MYFPFPIDDIEEKFFWSTKGENFSNRDILYIYCFFTFCKAALYILKKEN